MRHLHAPLQLCETGDFAVKRNNLAICDERRGFLLTNRFDHLGIFLIQPNLIPRKEVQIAPTAKGEATLPIPFRLKQPSLSRKHFIRECRQHGRNPAGLCPVANPGLDVSRQSVEQDAPGHGISPVNRRAKASRSPQTNAGRTSQRTISRHFFASPERIQSPKATNMPSQLRIAISETPLVPTQYDTSGAIDRASIVICCFARLIYQIVGDTHVICVAEIVPQRLQTPYKCSNLVLVKEASHKFDGVVYEAHVCASRGP